VAATLGYEDHEGAPADAMLAAAARIAGGVEAPVTVDAEAGYGMEPAELVAALRSIGAAGFNLEDTDHAAGRLRDPDRHTEWLRAVRRAAAEDGYRPVVNARVTSSSVPSSPAPARGPSVSLFRRRCGVRMPTSRPASTACTPIALWKGDALRGFVSQVGGPVNVARLPQAPSLAELAALGVARVSWGPSLYRNAIARFA
jgi:2-methylisocitrate lyase-like PEP mutase family enzyme